MKTIRLDGVVGLDFTAQSIAEQLEGANDVRLVINSPGGFLFEGMAIYNVLKDHAGHITARIDLAASAASLIAMAAEHISMPESSSVMMIHEVQGGAYGSKRDMRSQADTAEQLEQIIIGIYEQRTGIDRPQLLQMLEAETWMDAEECVRLGFADEVLRPSRTNLIHVVMSALKAEASAPGTMNLSTFCAKVDSLQKKVNNIPKALESAKSLKDIEATLRDEVGLSRNEATALVNSIKAVNHGERGDTEKLLIDKIQNLTARL
jgi:ATP-dependent protease ClpP protease subunit